MGFHLRDGNSNFGAVLCHTQELFQAQAGVGTAKPTGALLCPALLAEGGLVIMDLKVGCFALECLLDKRRSAGDRCLKCPSRTCGAVQANCA